MDISKEIITRIFRGITNVFNYYRDANIDISSQIKPEYLLTVKIAESLSENKTNFIIKLEEPTKEFATSCVKNYQFGFSEKHNSSRNGRIDIAVYSDEKKTGYYPNMPLFPIEIKNINPLKFDLLFRCFKESRLF